MKSCLGMLTAHLLAEGAKDFVGDGVHELFEGF